MKSPFTNRLVLFAALFCFTQVGIALADQELVVKPLCGNQEIAQVRDRVARKGDGEVTIRYNCKPAICYYNRTSAVSSHWEVVLGNSESDFSQTVEGSEFSATDEQTLADKIASQQEAKVAADHFVSQGLCKFSKKRTPPMGEL